MPSTWYNRSMRAALLTETGPIGTAPLRVVELPDPAPGFGEMTMEVTACGVCRTDLQIVEGDIAPRVLPVVPGHQAVGRVTAVGDGVQGWSIGDRAGAGWLASTCGACRFCTGGRENLCETARFTGWDRHGGYADRITVAAGFAYPLPVAAGDFDLAPLLCGGIIGYRALNVSGIEPGGRLGLFGFGASALLSIQVALHWECEVYVVTRSEAEQARAMEMGATWAGSSADAVPVRLDAAVTTAPVGSVVVAALASLGRGGIVAVNAIHLDGIPAFDYDLLWQERQLRSVANFTRSDAKAFLDLAAEIPVRTVVDAYPLEEANGALAAVRDGSVRGAAVVTMG